MRRLGIAPGVLGGAVGGLYAYGYGTDLWKSRATHARFESLMALPIMRQVSAEAADRFSQGKPVYMFTVQSEGIKGVGISSLDGHVLSIDLLSGEFVVDAKPASPVDYAGALALPVLGFLLPWGIIRALAWLILGFVGKT